MSSLNHFIMIFYDKLSHQSSSAMVHTWFCLTTESDCTFALNELRSLISSKNSQTNSFLTGIPCMLEPLLTYKWSYNSYLSSFSSYYFIKSSAQNKGFYWITGISPMKGGDRQRYLHIYPLIPCASIFRPHKLSFTTYFLYFDTEMYFYFKYKCNYIPKKIFIYIIGHYF